MDKYLLVLLLFGMASFGMAFMPAVTKRTGISYALIYVAAGAVIFALWPQSLPSPLPFQQNELTVHLTELIVIVSLMGTGIKIDRTFSIKKWAAPLRLVSITMLLCMIACCLFGYFLLGLAFSSAVLLAATLAPTDPVLAADVQVGPPEKKDTLEAKFALTCEAGMNDGMAFPFTWLAVVIALTGAGQQVPLFRWLRYYFVYKILAGLVVGWLCGKLAGYLVFSVSEKYRLIKPTDGFLAISLTLFAYGLTETLHGYGFIAVFITGYVLRHYEKGHTYHSELHSFTDQIERLLLGMLLIFFGGALVSGILKPLTVSMVIFSCFFVFLIRPAIAYLSLFGLNIHVKERLAIAFFGIKGVGSIFYLAFALEHAFFKQQESLWAIIAFTMLLSVVTHGLSATKVMSVLKTDQKIRDAS